MKVMTQIQKKSSECWNSNFDYTSQIKQGEGILDNDTVGERDATLHVRNSLGAPGGNMQILQQTGKTQGKTQNENFVLIGSCNYIVIRETAGTGPQSG